MLVMVLHKDQVTTLAMASAATMFSFAVGLAYLGTKPKDQEVLACVATYHVALVVFVGTNPQGYMYGLLYDIETRLLLGL